MLCIQLCLIIMTWIRAGNQYSWLELYSDLKTEILHLDEEFNVSWFLELQMRAAWLS
jgi:hypothetical protein